MNIPETLNGFPVISSDAHANGYATVVVARDPANAPCYRDLVVATWWPALGNQWMWGHYICDPRDGAETDLFHSVAARNAKRGTL